MPRSPRLVIATLVATVVMVEGCGSGGTPVSDAPEAKAAGAGHETDASHGTDAGETRVDASTPDPRLLCNDRLPHLRTCQKVIGSNPPVLGGDFPDGIYDRIEIPTNSGSLDSCGHEAIRFDRGVFQRSFVDDLGVTNVTTCGAVAVDKDAKIVNFIPAYYKDPDAGVLPYPNGKTEKYGYSWDATTQRLTLATNYPPAPLTFSTFWVYARRP